MLDLTFAPPPVCEDFMLNTNYVRVLAGPIGSSKSVTCVHELVRWATEQAPNAQGVRKTRFLICRNTADQLRSTTLKTIFDWLPPSLAGSWVVTEKMFYIRFGLADQTIVETEWMAIALDTPDDVRKALSLEATGLWGNEARELHPDVVDGLLMRVNRYPSPKDGGPTRPGAIFDTNMPQEGGWWFDKMVNPPKNWSVFVQPPAVLATADWMTKYGPGNHTWEVGRHIVTASASENGVVQVMATTQSELTTTQANLVATAGNGEEFVVDHEAENFGNLNASYYPNTLQGKKEDFVNVYLRCRFGRSLDGRPVFEGFRREFHVATSPLTPIDDPARPLIVGVDFGLSPACTISQIDPRGRMLTYADIASDNMGIYRFIHERLKPLLASRFRGLPVIVIGDPAGNQRVQTDEKTVLDVLREEGFDAHPASTNNIVRRIASVEELLSRVIDGKAAHLIDPSCTSLIGGMAGGYRYRVKRNGDIEDRPDKGPLSHVCDAHQYACLYVKDNTHGGHQRKDRRSPARSITKKPMSAWT